MNLNLNLKAFLKYLNRYKWLIIGVPLLSVIIAFLLVRRMPKSYVSSGLIATGITAQFQQALGEGQSLDYFKLSQQFGNLLEMIKSKRVINTLSYQLILHDLRNPKGAFQEYSDEMIALGSAQKQTAIQEYEKRLSTNALISVADNGNIKLYDILKSRGYDEESILKNLTVLRNGESDFIKATYKSSNPDLSAFVVNNLANDFINYYADLTLSGQRKSLAVLDTIVRDKQTELQKKNDQLTSTAASAAAASSGAMTAQKKADMAYQQTAEIKSQKAAMERTISSIQGAIAEVNKKLSGGGGYINSDIEKDNVAVMNIDDQLKLANQRYINNNFNAGDKASVDSLQRIRANLVARSANKTKGNPVAIQQALIDQKIKLEGDLASANSAMNTIDQQLNSMGGAGPVTYTMPTDNTTQQILSRDADLASKEYTDVQQKYEQTALAAKAGVKLSLAEPGLPGVAEPSKNMLYVGFAGISSLMICLLSLFVAFMLHTNLDTPEQLEAVTHQKVVGWLNDLKDEDKDLRKIWKEDENSKNYAIYKDALRSLRFEVNEKLNKGSNVLGITSVHRGEGKTFIAGSLSYAFAMMNKNVLLISDKDSSLTDFITNKDKDVNTQKFESVIVKKEIQIEDRITILNRNPGNTSLLEMRDNKSLEAGFRMLKNTFDVVIVDMGSAEDTHILKEWLMFCDYSVGVFEAGKKITDSHKEVSKYLANNNHFLGWILNKVQINNIHRISEKI